MVKKGKVKIKLNDALCKKVNRDRPRPKQTKTTTKSTVTDLDPNRPRHHQSQPCQIYTPTDQDSIKVNRVRSIPQQTKAATKSTVSDLDPTATKSTMITLDLSRPRQHKVNCDRS